LYAFYSSKIYMFRDSLTGTSSYHVLVVATVVHL